MRLNVFDKDPFVDDPDEEPDYEYEIVGRIFEAQYPGRCAIDPDHKVKRGDKVARAQRADNPLIPVPGVACKWCVKDYPRGRA